MTAKQGDVVLIDFTPSAGSEQDGKRPALVVSETYFNQHDSFVVLCPITNKAKGYGFEVPVRGAQKTTGVILSNQFKSLDYRARNMVVVDSVDAKTLAAVHHNIKQILGM